MRPAEWWWRTPDSCHEAEEDETERGWRLLKRGLFVPRPFCKHNEEPDWDELEPAVGCRFCGVFLMKCIGICGKLKPVADFVPSTVKAEYCDGPVCERCHKSARR